MYIVGAVLVSVGILALGVIPRATVSYTVALDPVPVTEHPATTREAVSPLPTTETGTPDETVATPPQAPSRMPTLEVEEVTYGDDTLETSSQLDGTAEEVPEEDEDEDEEKSDSDSTVFSVPFYSQLTDITSPEWRGIGCGIASLAMLIEFYNPGSLTSVDTLLSEGIATRAYIPNVGWAYAGLIDVSKKYGLSGTTYDFAGQRLDTAFDAFLEALSRGPVMASVHYTFVPTNPIPHLVIMTGIEGDTLYYNDPAESTGGGTVSVSQFKSSWKKRYIEFFPV